MLYPIGESNVKVNHNSSIAHYSPVPIALNLHNVVVWSKSGAHRICRSHDLSATHSILQPLFCSHSFDTRVGDCLHHFESSRLRDLRIAMQFVVWRINPLTVVQFLYFSFENCNMLIKQKLLFTLAIVFPLDSIRLDSILFFRSDCSIIYCIVIISSMMMLMMQFTCKKHSLQTQFKMLKQRISICLFCFSG